MHRRLGGAGTTRERSEAEREALLRVAAAVAGATALDDVIELAAEEALRALGAASLSISRYEPEGDHYRTLINVGELGPGETRRPEAELYPLDEYPLMREMARFGTPYFNSLDDPDCDAAAARMLKRLGQSSDLGVAIQVEGQIWGEIWAATHDATSPFRAEDVRFLEAIGGHLGTAIARAELFSKVSRLAYEDPLTGLANRRAFEERMERALQRHVGEGRSLGLLLCDVDRLKEINDEDGHIAGDRALKRVAEALVAAAADRPGAFVARLAGDEFCVLLESRELREIEQVGATALLLLAGEDGGISISCGIATAGKRTRTTSALLRAADNAQYVAKRKGGGRICTAAHVAEEKASRERGERTPGPIGVRIREATAEILRSFDEELAEANLLDRLEALGRGYTEAGDFSRWAISLAPHGRRHLQDLSVGENEHRLSGGVRVGLSTDQYALDEYPATDRVVSAGTGSFHASVADESTDSDERALLEQDGFEAVVGAVAGTSEGVYLLELFADTPDTPVAEFAVPLRLMMASAVPPHRHERSDAERGNVNARALELATELAGRLAEAGSEPEACEVVAAELERAFGCPFIHVLKLNGDRFELQAEASPETTPGDWSQRSDAGLIGRAISEDAPVISADTRREPQFRSTQSNRNALSELAVPVRVSGRPWGVINLEDTEPEAFTLEDARLLEAVAAQLAGALTSMGLYESLDRAYIGTAEALSAALEAKDSYTAEHSRAITDHAVAIGRLYGMDEEHVRMLRYGAAFHDVGKLAISREILNKPSALTAEERAAVEEHTAIGDRILEPIEFLAPARPMVRHAHERWDGSGYPDGLAGEAIPLGARILFVCDAYDAMTTDRPYRQAMPEAEARAELEACAGTQFDPDVVAALFRVLDDGVAAGLEPGGETAR